MKRAGTTTCRMPRGARRASSPRVTGAMTSPKRALFRGPREGSGPGRSHIMELGSAFALKFGEGGMLRKAMEVLDLFSLENRELGVLEVAAALGRPKSTVSRWLAS